MEQNVVELIRTIHDQAGRAVIVTAGAGTQAVASILGVSGASRTLMEVLVPYGKSAFDDFLGRAPNKYVSAESGQFLAGRALTRARFLADDGERVIGLACTATIVTDRLKRGDHRAHITTWTNERVVSYHLHLQKGARDRQGEERMVSLAMINALAEAFGLSNAIEQTWVAGDRLDRTEYNVQIALAQLYAGDVPYVGVHDYGRVRFADASPQVVLAGSFNPLHDGHLGMARAAAAQLGKPVAFELAVINADKPAVSAETALNRIAQFAGRWPIYASNAPTFLDKARLYGSTTFVVGYDTAARVLQPRFYGSADGMMHALHELTALGCRFLVAGRERDGAFHVLEDLNIPDGYHHLFTSLNSFRIDISSSELRAIGAKGSR